MSVRKILKDIGSVDRLLDAIRGEYPEDTDADGNVWLSEEEACKYLPPERIESFLKRRRKAFRE
jgi:hypothetical protein